VARAKRKTTAERLAECVRKYLVKVYGVEEPPDWPDSLIEAVCIHCDAEIGTNLGDVTLEQQRQRIFQALGMNHQMALPTPKIAGLAIPGELGASQIEMLVKAFLSQRKDNTYKAYSSDLQSFADWAGGNEPDDAARILLGRSHGEANALVLEYQTYMYNQRHLAPASINRRVAALRALVKLANMLGVVSWSLTIPDMRREAYQDTRGPSSADFKKMLEAAAGASKPEKAARDVAILRMLRDLALRQAELRALTMEDLDLREGRVTVLGKGRFQKVALTLPKPTLEALEVWLEHRGDAPGPIFHRLDRGSKGSKEPLTSKSMGRLISGLGEQVGIRVRPHGLRHSGITRALDVTGGDMRAAQLYARLSDPKILTIYDDNRRDIAGGVADLVAREEDDEEA